ncbi:ABC transporter permease [Spirillospora sp. NPDC048911]|uniref:ABC transporter permease n=1 Tax=Spirillospora sp. NPDC048911 TaxID=3364527 RepID=UPI00371E0655
MTTATVTRELPRQVGLPTGLRNTMTLTWRNLVQIKHNPMELVDLSVQPIMFVLLFAFVFGPAMAGSVEDYLPILIPGIIVQNALFASMTTGVGLNNDVTKGVFDRFRSLPIARSAPLAGRIIADTVKQAWSMFIVMVVGLIIGFRIETSWIKLLPAFGLLLAFSLLFAWVSVFVGLAVDEPEKVQIFGFTIIFPISFLSNAFIPVSDKYPGWIRAIMEHNPVSLLGDAIRGLLIGHKVTDPSVVQPVLAPAIQSLLWGVGIAAVFIPLSMRAFKRKV